MKIKDYIIKNGIQNLEKILTNKGRARIGFPNWIITDCRFPNEIKAIKDRGGVIIRVEREHCCGDVEFCDYGDGYNCTKTRSDHPSEIALDSYQDWDYVIENNGTIEELIEKVKVIYDEISSAYSGHF